MGRGGCGNGHCPSPGPQRPSPTAFSAVTPATPTWSPGVLPNATSRTVLWLSYGFLLQADSLHPLLNRQLSL